MLLGIVLDVAEKEGLMENTLGQWFSKCDPQINSITITWELV
jgi:hypothetical protein